MPNQNELFKSENVSPVIEWFGDKLPGRLRDELDALEKKLG